MNTKTYSVKEIAKLLEIESHVLRYYEKELDLMIHRNAQGHRVYHEMDVELFRQILDYTEQGLKLKAVRKILHSEEEDKNQLLLHLDKGGEVEEYKEISTSIDITNTENSKMQSFSELLKESMRQALDEYDKQTKEELKKEIKDEIKGVLCEEVKEEVKEEIHCIMAKQIREVEVKRKEKDDVYYNQLDEAMREMQRLRREMAELEDEKTKVGFWAKLFGKSKGKHIVGEEIKKEQSM